MPIGSGIVYNTGDLILSQVSGSGTAFLETKIAAATSSLIYFDSTARINSASLNSITVGTASYVSGSTSIITNLTASNISASGTSSFGYVGIGTNSPIYKLDVQPTSSTARLGNAIVGAWPVNTTFALFGHNNLDHTTSATNYALIQWNDGTTYLNASSGKVINFRISNADKMVLDVNGKLGIGTTAPLTGYLDVRSNQTKSVAGPTNIAFFGSSDGGNPLGLVVNHESSSGVKMVGLVGTEYGLSGNNIKINETLHVQYSGNVGIGTTIPGNRLEVAGSTFNRATFKATANVQTGIQIIRTGGVSNTDWEIYSPPSSGDLRIYNGSDYVTFQSGSGSVGIGTTSPNSKLEVAGPAGTAVVSVTNSGNGRSGSFGIDGNGVFIRNSNDGDYFDLKNASGVARFRVIYDNATHLTTNFVSIGNLSATGSKLSVFGNTSIGSTYGSTAAPTNGLIVEGNVGIGTTIPNNKLDIWGGTGTTFNMANDSDSGRGGKLTFISSSATGRQFYVGTNSSIYNLVFGIDSIEKMRLDTSGYFAINTTNTTPYSSLFPGQLVVDAGTSNVDGIFSSTNNTNAAELILTKKNPTNNFGSLLIQHSGSSGDAIALNYNVNTSTGVGGTNSFKVTTDGTGYFRGNVGIGTTSPGAKLDVSGSSTAPILNLYRNVNSATTPLLYGIEAGGSPGKTNVALFERLNNLTPANVSASSAGVRIREHSANYALSIEDHSNNSYFVVKGGGNVGIGTTSPLSLLDVRSGYITAGSSASTNGSTILAGYYSDSAGILTVLGTEYSSGGPVLGYAVTPSTSSTAAFFSSTTIAIPRSAYVQDGGTHRWYTGQSQTVAIGSAVSTSERMRMDISGQIGIGTSTPRQILHINGSILLDGLQNGYEQGSTRGIGYGSNSGAVNTDGFSGMDIQSVNAPAPNGGNYSQNVRFWTHHYGTGTGATPRMVIQYNGNVGIGTTSPNAKFDVRPDSSWVGSEAVIIDTDGSNNPRIKLYRPDGASTTSSYAIHLRNDSGNLNILNTGVNSTLGSETVTSKFYITTVGNVGIGTTVPVAKLQVAGNISGSSFTSSISNAVGFLGTSSWAQNVVSASFATTAQTANALNTSNNYQVNSIGVGMAGSGTAGRIGLNEVGIRSWSITPTGGRLVIEAGDGLGSVIFSCPVTSSNFVGPGTGLTGTAASLTAGTANALNASNTYTVAGLTSAYVDVTGAGTIPTTGIYRPSTKTLGLSADGTLIFKISNVSAPATSSIETGNFVVQSGNVGIGATSPNAKLDVRGYIVSDVNGNAVESGFYLGSSAHGLRRPVGSNDIYLHTTTGNLYLGTTGNTSQQVTVLNSGNVGIGTVTPAAKLEISGSGNSALLNIKSPISGAILYVSGSGAVGINTTTVGAFTLQVNGSFGATTKSFIIDHPTKAGKKLMYGSLESPYHGIRLTGRDTLVNGKCKVELPDYIYKLILHDSVNIQLTGIKCNKTLYVDDINIPENYFTIAYDKAIFESYKDYEFFWDFTAIRSDVPELTTEL